MGYSSLHTLTVRISQWTNLEFYIQLRISTKDGAVKTTFQNEDDLALKTEFNIE